MLLLKEIERAPCMNASFMVQCLSEASPKSSGKVEETGAKLSHGLVQNAVLCPEPTEMDVPMWSSEQQRRISF